MGRRDETVTNTIVGDEADGFGAGDIIAGRYSVERPLGSGGMGVVYLVRDRHDGAPLALKYVSRDRLDDSTLERLRAEFRTSAQHEHPHLLHSYDFGSDYERGGYFFTSEYTDGVDLLRAVSGLDLTRAEDRETFFTIFVQLLRGLAFLHDQRIVYGDLKPENVIVAGGERPHVKLIDFGLVREEGQLRGDRVWATPSYVAPETILGARVGHREDLYSLGVVLYEATTGVRPFMGASNLEVLRGHLESEPIPPRELVPELPPPFDPLILGLLEKKPDQRPERAAEVIAEIVRSFDLPFSLEDATTAPAHLIVGETAVRERERATAIRALRSACLQTESHDEFPEELRGTDLGSSAGGTPAGRTLWIRGDHGSGEEIILERVRREAQLQGIGVLELDAADDSPGAIVLWLEQVMWRVRESRAEVSIEAFLGLRAALSRKAEDADADLEGLIEGNLARTASKIVEYGSNHPLLVVVRNLHESTELALRLVLQMTRAEERAGVSARHLLVVTSRFDESATPAETIRRSHFRNGLTIDLESIDEKDVVRFLAAAFRGGEFPPRFIERVIEESDGNLRNARTFLRHYVDQLWIARSAGGWTLRGDSHDAEFSGPVREDIRERLRELPDEVYRLAVALTFIGPGFELSCAGNLAEVPGDRHEPAIRHLLEARIVREGPVGDRGRTYSLISASTRSTIYGLLTPEQRRALHELTGQLIESLPGEKSSARLHDLAHHFSSAGNREKGNEYGLASAEILAAEPIIDRALAMFCRVRDLREGEPTVELLPLIRRMAELRLQVGDYRGIVSDAARVRQSKDVGVADRQSIELGALRAHARLGEFEEARTRLAELTLSIAEDDLDASLELGLAEAELHHVCDAHVESLRACEAAHDRIEGVRSPELETRVHLALGEYYDILGAAGDAARHCQRALRLLDTSREPRHLADSLFARGRYYIVRRQYADAVRLLRLALLHLRDSNSFAGVADCMLELGRLQHKLGNLGEAHRYLEAARSVYRRIEAHPRAVEAEVELVEVDRLLGHLDGLEERTAQAVRSAGQLKKPDLLDRALLAAAARHLDRGDLARGKETLRILKRRRGRLRRSGAALELTLLQAEATLGEGDIGTALEYATAAVQDARELRDPLLVTRSLRWETMILLRLGRTSEARRSLASLLDLAIGQKLPLEEGWGRLLDAIALLNEEKHSLATRAFAIAHEQLTEHGGPRDLIELHLHRSWCHFATDDLELAYISLEEGLHLVRRLDLAAAVPRFLIGRAAFEAERPEGNAARVEEYLEQAVESAKHYPEPRWQALDLWARWRQTQGATERATELEQLATLALAVVVKKLPPGTEQSYRRVCSSRKACRTHEPRRENA